MGDTTFRIVVAIPAKDEADLLPLCLQAISRQREVDMRQVAVVVGCNNCVDDTAARALSLADTAPYTLVVDEVLLPKEIAHAGGARRHAMDKAADLCAPDGFIVTTDADGVADDDWLWSFEKAFAKQVDAVAGRVSTDWEELQRFPTDVLDVGAREWRYQGLCAELEALSDPEPHDPWPRHNQTCGANIAITASAYKAVGGLPILRTGEDGALAQKVLLRDGRLRHDVAPHVTVSARLIGRAQGGMADALAQRHGDAYLCDDLLEPADDLFRRAKWRHSARAAFKAKALATWVANAGIGDDVRRRACAAPTFGQAWMYIEASTPILVKRRLGVTDLDTELVRVEALLESVRAKAPLPARAW